MKRILFVCLGNICRSPTAEGVLRHKAHQAGLADRVEFDSAGTGDWHIGKAPDPRTCAAALRRGYDLSGLRARQFEVEDFHRFDLVLCMDQTNLAEVRKMAGGSAKSKTDLFLRRYDLVPGEVPDPYYGGDEGFDTVLDLIEHAADALIQEVRLSL